MVDLTWGTASDWDAGTAESGVVHDSFGDLPGDDTLTLGYPAADEGGSALQGYWPLDEDSGTTAAEVSGNGVGGTIVGDPARTSGMFGRTAFDFDGSAQRVEIGEPTMEGAITVSCWAQGDAWDVDQETKVVAGPYNDGDGDGVTEWELRTSPDGDLSVGSYQDGTLYYAGIDASTLTNGEWHHFAGRYSGSRWDLFIDGENATTVESSDQSVGAIPTEGTVAIGQQYETVPDSFQTPFDGRIDEVRLYNRSLSEAEIQRLATVPITGSFTSASQTT